jgi:hypothetical protein
MVSILLPILDKLAEAYDIDYHYLIVPVAIAVNFSYAFPAAGKCWTLVMAFEKFDIYLNSKIYLYRDGIER